MITCLETINVRRNTTKKLLWFDWLSIEKGNVLVYLGRMVLANNIRQIINQITAPDSGSIQFNGEVFKREHIKKIGYLRNADCTKT